MTTGTARLREDSRCQLLCSDLSPALQTRKAVLAWVPAPVPLITSLTNTTMDLMSRRERQGELAPAGSEPVRQGQ